MSNNIIIPSSAIDYKLIDRFNRGTALEINGTAPGWIKNAATYVVDGFGGDTGLFTTNDAGYLASVNNQPGAQDLMTIDIGESYSNIYIECLAATSEQINIHFHATPALQRNATGFYSFESRIKSDTVYTTRSRINADGIPSFVTDDGTGDGDSSSDEVATTITEATKIRVKMSFDGDYYTIKTGDFVRRWAKPANMVLSNYVGLSMTANPVNTFIYDLRVW